MKLSKINNSNLISRLATSPKVNLPNVVPTIYKGVNPLSKNKFNIGKLLSDPNSRDIIGLSVNTIGSLISHIYNNSTLNNMQPPVKPIGISSRKLKTKYNINPQLKEIDSTTSLIEDDIDANTASSRTALQRKGLARLNRLGQINSLYGLAENRETDLINRDRMNQQQVDYSNVSQQNDYNNRKVAFMNNILDKKSENFVGLNQNVSSIIQDILQRRDAREANDRNARAIIGANPAAASILHGLGVRDNTDLSSAIDIVDRKGKKLIKRLGGKVKGLFSKLI